MGRDVVPSTPGAAYADPSDAGGFAKAPAVPKVKDWERRDPCFCPWMWHRRWDFPIFGGFHGNFMVIFMGFSEDFMGSTGDMSGI